MPKYNVRPVERTTLAPQVMRRLIDFVNEAELEAGDVLPSQHELARQLGVSRPVLREAMQGLASIGFLEIQPGRGCYIGQRTPSRHPSELFEIASHDAALQALEARMVVELALAGLAAARATEHELQNLESALKRIDEAILQGSETSEHTLRFHQLLAAAGHNAYLLQMSELLDKSRVAQFMRVENSLPDVKTGEFESHHVLLEAIRARNPDVARAAMLDHLKDAHGHEARVNKLQREKTQFESNAGIDNTRHDE